LPIAEEITRLIQGEIMRRFALYSVALLCLGTTQALCLSDKPYLNAADADFGNLLPPPPADGSALDKRDMQGVLDLQKNLTPARLEQIQADTEQTVYRVAGEVFGPTFTKDKFPLAGAFFDKVRDDSAVGVRDIKQKYKRLRPFQANKEIRTPDNIARASQGPTYPSGHSTFGAEAALLLSMMVPEKTAELHARAWQYGEQRIASGVAYPSDWETAHIGATLMVALMMQKPEFRADFQSVKTELRKGLGLSP
jgi:acid phosphatase (class A)